MIIIGLDVGWSETRATCGFAVMGVEPPNHAGFKSYNNGNIYIYARCFRKCDLVEYLCNWRAVLAQHDVFAIIDGPLGQTQPPAVRRAVDTQFGSGPFHGLMQPNHVDIGTGPVFVNATEELARALVGDRQARPAFGWNGPQAHDQVQTRYAETNPTVGLALMLDYQTLVTRRNNHELPTRRQPVIVDGFWCRAKSDYYWVSGGNNACARILGCNEVADERHHERIAALYCLAAAKRLSEGENNVHVAGADSGKYVFPNAENDLHNSWVHHLNLPAAQVHAGAGDAGAPPPGIPENGPDDDENVASDEDDNEVALILTDNGGIWETANPWLEEYGQRLNLNAVDPVVGPILLKRANGPRHWCSDPTPLELARRRGYLGPHLTNIHAMAVQVAVAGNE